jgi:hypothetical protein
MRRPDSGRLWVGLEETARLRAMRYGALDLVVKSARQLTGPRLQFVGVAEVFRLRTRYALAVSEPVNTLSADEFGSGIGPRGLARVCELFDFGRCRHFKIHKIKGRPKAPPLPSV